MVLDITKPHIWVVDHGYIYITQCNFFSFFMILIKLLLKTKNPTDKWEPRSVACSKENYVRETGRSWSQCNCEFITASQLLKNVFFKGKKCYITATCIMQYQLYICVKKILKKKKKFFSGRKGCTIYNFNVCHAESSLEDMCKLWMCES